MARPLARLFANPPFFQGVFEPFFGQIAGRRVQLDDTTTVERPDFDHHETKLRVFGIIYGFEAAPPSCELPHVAGAGIELKPGRHSQALYVGLCDADLHGRGLKEPSPVIAGKLSIKLFDH